MIGERDVQGRCNLLVAFVAGAMALVSLQQALIRAAGRGQGRPADLRGAAPATRRPRRGALQEQTATEDEDQMFIG